MKPINAVIVQKNTFEYPDGKQVYIPTTTLSLIGMYWRVPVVGNAVLVRFAYKDGSIAKPTPDSLKIIRVRDQAAQDTYDVVLADGASVATLADLIGICCEDDATMPAVVIPPVMVEEVGCADDDGVYHYFSITSALGAGEVYISNASLNGVALTALSAAGYASLGALETAAEAAWTPATITIVGTKVTLNTATGTTGYLSVTKRKYFESNTPGALTSGDHYVLNATINGVTMPTLSGAVDAVLSTMATAANANATYASYGVWSEVSGKLRLVSKSGAVQTATIAVTKVT